MKPETLATAVVETIKRALTPRDEKIAELEAKCLQLETKHELLAKVMASSQQRFKQHAIAHDDLGARWVAERDTVTAPGTSGDWRLIEDGRVQ